MSNYSLGFLNICGIYSDVMSLIPHIGNLYFLSFYPEQSGSILLIFSQNYLLDSLTFSVFCSFSISVISSLIFIISFLLLYFWIYLLFFFQFLKMQAGIIDLRHFYPPPPNFSGINFLYSLLQKYHTNTNKFCFHLCLVKNTF